MEDLIYDFAEENNIIIGICDADRLDYLGDRNIAVPFINRYTWEERITPRLTMPNAKSIIIIGVGYRIKRNYINDCMPRTKLSVNAVGIDYHKTVYNMLSDLENILESKNENLKSMKFVDTGPLIEREFAKKAGLGWEGKNRCIISDKLGSFFNIGYLLVNIYLKKTNQYEFNFTKCGSCKECIKVCPGNAIINSDFKTKKCISYLTQCKDILDYSQMKSMGNQLYGCDKCQNVCKFNRDKFINKKVNNIDEIEPKIFDVLNLSNNQLKNRFPSISWRGKQLIQRNSIISLANSSYNNIVYEELYKKLDLSNIMINNAMDYLKSSR